MNSSRIKRFLNPKVIFLLIVLLLAVFYLFYYQLPSSTTLSGTAGAVNASNSFAYAVFYQHYYYGGYSYFAHPGQYASFPYTDVSSITLHGGSSVIIYDGYNFTGRFACVNSDNSGLGNIGFNDMIRSVVIYPNQGCQ